MINLEKRIRKLEKFVKTNYNHSGVFLIFVDEGIFTMQNYEDKGKSFNNMKELENYIYGKYDAEKYVFLAFVSK